MKNDIRTIRHIALAGLFTLDLLEQRKTHDAIAFSNYYRESGVNCGKMLLDWGKVYTRLGSKKFAADCVTKVLLLDPSNVEAANKLKEIGELRK